MLSLIRQWFGKKPGQSDTSQPMTMLNATIWACEWKGLLNREHAEWFAAHVQRGESGGLGIDQIAREIRVDGGEMTSEEKKARGIRNNLKIGLRCYERLSDAGRQDPNKAVRLTVHAALFRYTRFRKLAEMRERKVFGFVRVINSSDERDCEASKGIKGQIFPLDKAPELPLRECDADMCRCLYIAEFPRRRR